MRRAWLLLLFLALAAALAFGLWRLLAGRALDQASRLAKDVDVDVSMQGVELSQGGEGHLQWKLKASGAQYLQDNGTIRVDSPVVTYYGGPEGDRSRSAETRADRPIVVEAPKGEVLQNDEVVTLWPEVTVTLDTGTIRSEKLVYKGKDERSITMTGSVVLTRGDLTVRAPKVVYDLKDDIIAAWGGVEADIAPSRQADKGAKQ